MLEYFGIIIIIILLLWLIFHKNKRNQQENEYQNTLGQTIMTLPTFTKHYIGID